jgi:putative ABC transport system ATP-binding protein
MAKPITSAVVLRGISKSYRVGHEKRVALDDVSLRIGKGELVAIVGPSGAGKTTLANIIGGLLRPDNGQVIVQSKQLDRLSDRLLSRYRNRQVGFVFQNFSLLPNFTAIDNVCTPLVIAGVPHRKRVKLAKQYLSLVGLEQQANQRANQLSGGERQRVAIARALIMCPKLIIADEPTGSLDSTRGQSIMDLLTELAHKQGLTVCIVTHDERLASRTDRILHLEDGHLTELAV